MTKSRRKQKRKEIRQIKTTLHERHRQELKALLEEEKETRAERKQLEAQYKQREDAVAARLAWTTECQDGARGNLAAGAT